MPPYRPYSKPLAIALIVLGVICIVAPLLSSVAITMIFACAIFAAGIAHLILAFGHQRPASRVWHIVAALVLIVGGGWLIALPLDAAASFTLVLASLFVLSGLMRIAAWLGEPAKAAHLWTLVDGTVTTILGAAVIAMWPESSLWLIGTLAGVNLIFNGIAALQSPPRLAAT